MLEDWSNKPDAKSNSRVQNWKVQYKHVRHVYHGQHFSPSFTFVDYKSTNLCNTTLTHTLVSPRS
jgi:hypothetical protein